MIYISFSMCCLYLHVNNGREWNAYKHIVVHDLEQWSGPEPFLVITSCAICRRPQQIFSCVCPHVHLSFLSPCFWAHLHFDIAHAGNPSVQIGGAANGVTTSKEQQSPAQIFTANTEASLAVKNAISHEAFYLEIFGPLILHTVPLLSHKVI